MRMGFKEDKRSLLTLLVLASSLLLATGVWAQEEEEEEDAAELEPVVVTGSRIARTDIEGPAPVVILTAEEMEREGFTTVYEALKTITSSANYGQTEGDGGTFTQNANAINLRGLGSGRTLILFNGRRATDYPLPFNGRSNLVNLSAIPAVAVERIEILSGGASAIYGSDAVAGVVNVIMKTDIEETTLNVRIGETGDGGGESQRLQLTGGWNNDRFSISYAAEYFHTDPIWAYEREYMDDWADNPDVVNGLRDVNGNLAALIWDGFGQDGDGTRNVQFSDDDCGRLPEYEFLVRPTWGAVCGRTNDSAEFTFRSERDNLSIFTNWEYEMTDTTQLFGTVSYWGGDATFTTGTPFWGSEFPGAAFFLNTNGPDVFGIGGRLERWQRIYTLTELGGDEANANQFEEDAWDAVIGVRGTLFDDKFDYELAYSTAQYDVDRGRTLQLKAEADDYFYGPDLGAGIFGYRFHAGNYDSMLSAMTPAIWQSITGNDRTSADSSNEQMTFVVSGDLWEMPAGPVGFAAVAEWATQDYEITLDPRFGETDSDGNVVVPNEWWGFTATGGGGDRDRYALGVEFGIPVTDSLRMTLASRWDKYDDITEVDDAVTYNAGLEWRPSNKLLLRGTWATSFRAPDMHFIYKRPSGSFSSATDQYRCRRDEPGVPFVDCTIGPQNYFGQSVGNPFLKEEESDSLTFGFVWELTENFSVSADYYKIELEDQVGYITAAYTLEKEADCRLGVTTGGTPVDINSGECQDALRRIRRNPITGTPTDEDIVQIDSGPINRAVLNTSGIDTTVNYSLNTVRAGRFSFAMQHSLTIDKESAEFAEDPVEGYRDNLQVFEWRSRVRGSGTWSYKDFSTTLFFTRTGSLPNWAETGRTGPHIQYNLSMAYDVTQNQRVSLFVQNVFDAPPLRDQTFNSYPYFLFRNYDPTGREFFLQYAITFGQ
jgi:outer membrane receptor protein involved in Fe transport